MNIVLSNVKVRCTLSLLNDCFNRENSDLIWKVFLWLILTLELCLLHSFKKNNNCFRLLSLFNHPCTQWMSVHLVYPFCEWIITDSLHLAHTFICLYCYIRNNCLNRSSWGLDEFGNILSKISFWTLPSHNKFIVSLRTIQPVF